MQRHSRLTRRTALKSRSAKAFAGAPANVARKLWPILRDARIAGLQFRQRELIGPYLVDFTCPAARIVIVLTGETPDDGTMTQWLAAHGYRVLQFPNADVLRNPQIVLDAIAQMSEIRAVPEDRSAKFDPPSRGG